MRNPPARATVFDRAGKQLHHPRRRDGQVNGGVEPGPTRRGRRDGLLTTIAIAAGNAHILEFVSAAARPGGAPRCGTEPPGTARPARHRLRRPRPAARSKHRMSSFHRGVRDRVADSEGANIFFELARHDSRSHRPRAAVGDGKLRWFTRENGRRIDTVTSLAVRSKSLELPRDWPPRLWSHSAPRPDESKRSGGTGGAATSTRKLALDPDRDHG